MYVLEILEQTQPPAGCYSYRLFLQGFNHQKQINKIKFKKISKLVTGK